MGVFLKKYSFFCDRAQSIPVFRIGLQNKSSKYKRSQDSAPKELFVLTPLHYDIKHLFPNPAVATACDEMFQMYAVSPGFTETVP